MRRQQHADNPAQTCRTVPAWMSWIVFGPGMHSGGVGLAEQSTGGGGSTIGPGVGVGAPTVKSLALLPVLLNGSSFRCAEVAADSNGVGA